MDGIDALGEISGEAASLRCRLVAYHEIPFPDAARDELLAPSDAVVASSRISQLDCLLGKTSQPGGILTD